MLKKAVLVVVFLATHAYGEKLGGIVKLASGPSTDPVSANLSSALVPGTYTGINANDGRQYFVTKKAGSESRYISNAFACPSLRYDTSVSYSGRPFVRCDGIDLKCSAHPVYQDLTVISPTQFSYKFHGILFLQKLISTDGPFLAGEWDEFSSPDECEGPTPNEPANASSNGPDYFCVHSWGPGGGGCSDAPRGSPAYGTCASTGFDDVGHQCFGCPGSGPGYCVGER